MDFNILPYDQLPEFIRENENLRQTLLQSGGLMKYVAEHIDDPTDDDTPQLFVQYQNYVADNYRRANRYNPNRQNWSVKDMRQRALNGSKHLWNELQSRRVLMHKLRMQTDLPHGAKSIIDNLNLKYLDYAWKEDLRRRRPDIDTDLGTYKYVIQQFERYSGFGTRSIENSLACRSIDIALKNHYGYELTETDNYDSFNIEMFHTHFFGPTILYRLQRGLAELLHDKNAQDCRAEAMGMLNKVQWFSQRIYNDEVEDVYNDSFTIEDKKWLRSLLEHYDRDSFSEEELTFFYFGKLLADIGRLWAEQLLSYANIDLSELEKEANSFINTEPSVRQITWEIKKKCFKNAVLHVMEVKKKNGDYLFERNRQWMAVYRFTIDYDILYDKNDPRRPKDPNSAQYKIFKKLAKELQLDEEHLIRKPFEIDHINDMSKKLYDRYRKPHTSWTMEGLKHLDSFAFYESMNELYKELKKEYEVLISQAEQVTD